MAKIDKVQELEAALRHAREIAERERAARRAAEESAKRAWSIALWGGAQRQGGPFVNS